MQYYKKIEWNYLKIIAEKSMDYLASHRPDILERRKNLSFWPIKNLNEFFDHIPEIQSASAVHGITCTYAAFYSMHRYGDGQEHIDNYIHNARINLPILNCTGTLLKYYTGGIPIPYYSPESSSKMTTHRVLRTPDTVQVAQVEIDAATVIRVNEIHAIYMPPAAPPRITLTLDFDKDVEFMLAEI